MTQKYILLPLLMVSMSMGAQDVADTTDVFFQHLELNEVVVTGLTGETRLSHSPTPVTVLTGRTIHSTAATNLIDAIALQPGMAQITTGGGISKPVIRGLGYNRIVTISDGVRQEGQQWGDEHGIEIDAEAVSSVEILKGPASLMYGSDAMAGVLLFHPARIAPMGQLRGNISSEYQTNNGLFGYSFNLGGNHNGFVWNARWSQKLAHEYKNHSEGYVPGTQFREQALNTMLGLNKNWGYSHLTLGYFHLQPGITEEGALDPLQEGERDYSYGIGIPFQHVHHYKAIWDNSFWMGENRLKATIGYQQNQRKEYEESPDDYSLYFRLHTLTYDVRYLVDNLNGWKLAAGIGGMWQRSQNLGEEVLIPAYRLWDVGAFITAAHDLGPVHIEGGLRFDRRMLHSYALAGEEEEHEAHEHEHEHGHAHHDFFIGDERFSDFSRNFNGLSGSIGAVWQATPQLNVRLNIARGFRAPNLSELGSNGLHHGTERYELGNHELKAEHSLQADLGLDFSSEYVSAQLTLFANRISNYIYAVRDIKAEYEEMTEVDYRLYRYMQGDARLLGFETGIDFHPTHSLHFENTFSYVDARQRHQPLESRYLPLTPAPRWNSELKYEFTHHGRIFNNSYATVGVETNFRQSHYYRADETETATPAYALLNLSAGTDILVKKRKVAEVYLLCDNLLDKGYQNHLSRLKYADINNATGRRGVFNMGRNVVMRVVVPFTLRRAQF